MSEYDEIPLPPEPDDEHQGDEPTTWEPVDLDPWLSGEHVTPEPTVGISRSDGCKLIYPGKEHLIYGETESGKSWLALECAAVEIRMGRDVVYIHYEESDPGSTIERLRLLGASHDDMRRHLRFVAPSRPSRSGWLLDLLTPAPVLVIHDGVNEAMSLHGADSMATEGAASFRRNLIVPCLRAGAATVAADHVTKSSEGRGRYAIGSAHKVAAIDGAAFMVENIEPFGRGLRGASRVYVTKDRPGQLRAHGKPTSLPGKTFFGVLTVDDTGNSPDFLTFWAPKDDSDKSAEPEADPKFVLADKIHKVLASMPDGVAGSQRDLFAAMRVAEMTFRNTDARDALDILVSSDRAERLPAGSGFSYRAIVKSPPDSASQPPAGPVRPASASASASPIGGDAGRSRKRLPRPASGRSGTQWDAVPTEDGTE